MITALSNNFGVGEIYEAVVITEMPETEAQSVPFCRSFERFS